MGGPSATRKIKKTTSRITRGGGSTLKGGGGGERAPPKPNPPQELARGRKNLQFKGRGGGRTSLRKKRAVGGE